jgi:hypothetical protein
MKIVIKTMKPRNPVAVAGRKRSGHAHDSYQPMRHERRSGKLALRKMLKTNFKKEE